MRAAVVAFLLMAAPAQAAETILLACTGTAEADNGRKYTAKESLVVNLTAQTVHGFNVVAHIESANDISIEFAGKDSEGCISCIYLAGELDRNTGVLSVRREWRAAPMAELACPGPGCETIDFNMVCKVTKRLF